MNKSRGILVLFLTSLAGCQSIKHDQSKPSTDGPAILSVVTADLNAQDISSLSLSGAENLRYQRNSLVGKYIQQSDVLCSDYLQDLTRTQRSYSLIFGSLSTIFGGAGAAFTHAAAVRPLSALASISSGERAEIDADTFAKQTSQVIIAGIKNSRARTYNTIIQVNFLKSVTDWPLTAALADVQDYHSRCSLHEGITEAAASISAVAPQSNPQATSLQTGVAGRSESPPTLATVSSGAVAGAAAAVAANGGTGISTAAGAAGAAAGAANAAGGNNSPIAASTAGVLAAAPIVLAQQQTPTPVVVTPINSTSVANIARIQLALVKKGSATVVVDGVLGKETVAAIAKFQSIQSPPIPSTGVADAVTTLALGVKVPASPLVVSSSPELISKLQALLLKQIFGVPISNKLRVTGILDAQTIAALIVYQDSQGLPLTGVIDADTIKHLGLS